MKATKTVLIGVLLVSCWLGAARGAMVDFDKSEQGKLPAGWLAGVTGEGAPKWSVELDATAPSKSLVLKQGGTFASKSYPWCVKQDAKLKDGFVQVKFKPISGKEDQAGGLIWRWQDGDNYYVARANALEDNITIYHTLKGKRTEFKRVPAKVATQEWHTLRVDFKGSHFIVTCDGKQALEWDDTTFPDAGAVGVWTKADSVTLFDNFEFEGK